MAEQYVALGAGRTADQISYDNDSSGLTAQDVQAAIDELAAGGGASPGGADTQIQYNDSGSFAGSPKLVFDEAASFFAVNGTAQIKPFGGPATTPVPDINKVLELFAPSNAANFYFNLGPAGTDANISFALDGAFKGGIRYSTSDDRLSLVTGDTIEGLMVMPGGEVVISGTAEISGLLYPTSDGNSGDVLTTDGAGNLSFEAPASGGGFDIQTVTTVAPVQLLEFSDTADTGSFDVQWNGGAVETINWDDDEATVQGKFATVLGFASSSTVVGSPGGGTISVTFQGPLGQNLVSAPLPSFVITNNTLEASAVPVDVTPNITVAGAYYLTPTVEPQSVLHIDQGSGVGAYINISFGVFAAGDVCGITKSQGGSSGNPTINDLDFVGYTLFNVQSLQLIAITGGGNPQKAFAIAPQ